jgi:hypothetical protein
MLICIYLKIEYLLLFDCRGVPLVIADSPKAMQLFSNKPAVPSTGLRTNSVAAARSKFYLSKA